jgi:amino-acid N-acetyltransferase
MTDTRIAAGADLVAALDLIERSGLPLDGLTDHADRLLVVRDEDRVVGSAALELYGDVALLRSVAVDTALRGLGVGQRVTLAALGLARQRGVRDVFLLTTTAETFFPRFGFEPTTRANVPDAVQQSAEFTSACPASAVVLRKHINTR